MIGARITLELRTPEEMRRAVDRLVAGAAESVDVKTGGGGQSVRYTAKVLYIGYVSPSDFTGLNSIDVDRLHVGMEIVSGPHYPLDTDEN